MLEGIIGRYLECLIQGASLQPFFGEFTSSAIAASGGTATFTPSRNTNFWLLFTDFELSVTKANLTEVTFTVRKNGQALAPFVDLILFPQNGQTQLPDATTGILSGTPIVYNPNAAPSFLVTNNSGDTTVARLIVKGLYWDGQYTIPSWEYGDAVSGL